LQRALSTAPRLNLNSEMEVYVTGIGSSRCDDLARVQRANGIMQEGTNAK
jgi:hypothetical protein